ncbi:carboxylesterase/lipase family protein [Maricaulis parjimensis]|uniref:carboxylesterase/lipase family protein n=1 Tax=Maricaulis parjimensis TaxID=144023 RepID=UPI00193A4BC9|nr:carboxylesterase family protein [Maricaulis parjimensis]
MHTHSWLKGRLSRRAILAAGGASLGMSALTGRAFGDVDAQTVATQYGQVRGDVERGVRVFRGLPYAGPVSGREQRFRAPTPPASWSGVRDATQFGPQAIQPVQGPGGEPSSEDCLFLNIWTPDAQSGSRPVMFYCHGGGFTVGSGAREYQNGANLAREQDVVVVAVNHRLGVFGYLYLGGLLGDDYPANPGLLDLVAALDWVRSNIAAFGGDPENVTIFGESGGGGKVSCLYAMPQAAPLFARASIESPIGPNDWSPEQATDVAREAMRWFDLNDPAELLDLSAEQWLNFQNGGDNPLPPGSREPGEPPANRDQWFWPVIDGQVLPEVPFKEHAPAISANKPLIIGTNRDEAVFFHFGDPEAFSLDEAGLIARLTASHGSDAAAWLEAFRASRPDATPSQLLMAIETAMPWRAQAVHVAEAKAAEGQAPVYAYILDYHSTDRFPGTEFEIGSPHASDIVMKFNNVGNPGMGSFFGNPTPPEQRLAAHNMSSLWGSFARQGVPTVEGQPQWRPYTLSGRETYLIDAACRLVSDPEAAERQFWQGQLETRGTP